MSESGTHPRRRARIAIAALLGVIFALLPATTANAAGSISVNFPSTAGITWTAGSTQQVSWSTTGLLASVKTVKLELYKGGVVATTNSMIKSSTPASGGVFNWPIPVSVPPGTDYKIKVTSSDGLVSGQSTNDFSIVAPTATLLSPDGTETFRVGAKNTISWHVPITGNVMLELYNGSTYKTIKASVPASAGKYDWDVPVTQASGTTFRVRISAVGAPQVNDSSTADFSILNPVAAVTVPTASDSWVAGTKHDITWSVPIPGNVRVDLMANGVFYKNIKSSVAAAVGKFNWDIPLTVATGSQYQVRVTAVANSNIFADSPASFDVTYPSITGVTPTGGTVTGGAKQTVTWTPSTTPGNVKLELVGGPSAILIKPSIAASLGTYSWDVPITLSTSVTYKVKVSSVTQGLVNQQSLAAFTISLPTPSVTAPTNAQAWIAGTTQQVKWTFAGPGNVKLDLYKGGIFVTTIKSSVAASVGTVNWAIPLTLAQGTNYQVYVKSLLNAGLSTLGPAAFTINLPTVTPTNLVGTVIAGTKTNLAWTPVAGNVRLDYTSNGSTFFPIRSSVVGTLGIFAWDVPINIASGSTYQVRVSSVSNLTGITGITTNFTIGDPTVSVTLPANNAVISKAGTPQVTISWGTTGPLSGNVKIELVGTGGKLLKSSIAASAGSFIWVIGTQVTGAYKIRITSLGRSSVTDEIDITLNA